MGLLQDKINDIKNEYMLYQYIDRSPRLVGDNNVSPETAAFKEMLDKIYERKQILSEILKANQNNTLGEREEELSKQLLESDKYFSSISPENMNYQVSFFNKAEDKNKEIPRFQSYQMIYKNLINAAKLQKVHTTASEAAKKMQTNKETLTNNCSLLRQQYTDKNALNSKIQQISNLCTTTANANKSVSDINKQITTITQEITNKAQIYSKETEALTKKLETTKEKLACFDALQNPSHALSQALENYGKHSKNVTKLTEEIDRYKYLRDNLDSLKADYNKSIREQPSHELKALRYYKKILDGEITFDGLSSALPLFKEDQTFAKDTKIDLLFADVCMIEYTSVRQTFTFFSEEYPLLSADPSDKEWELREQMTGTQLLTTMETLAKERAEHFGPSLQQFIDLQSVYTTFTNSSNEVYQSVWQMHLDKVIQLGLLPEDNKLSNDELKNLSGETLKDYITTAASMAQLKRDALKPTLVKKYNQLVEKVEKNLPETDKNLFNQGKELDAFFEERDTLSSKLLEINAGPSLDDMSMQNMIHAAKEKANTAKLQFRNTLNNFLIENNLSDEFTLDEKEALLNANYENVMPLIHSKIEKMKAQITETEKQLAEVPTKQEEYEKEKNSQIDQLKQQSDKIIQNIQEQTDLIKKDMPNDVSKQTVDEIIQTSADLINTQKEASNEVNDMLVQEFEEFKKEAQEWLKMAELHKNGHKDSTLFTKMIESVKKFINTDNNSPEMKTVVEELKGNTKKYLDAKNGQIRLIPTDLRKTRMTLGGSIKLFSDKVLNVLESVNELAGVKEAENKQAGPEKENEKVNEVKQPEKEVPIVSGP